MLIFPYSILGQQDATVQRPTCNRRHVWLNTSMASQRRAPAWQSWDLGGDGDEKLLFLHVKTLVKRIEKQGIAGKWAFIAPSMLPKLNDKLINLSKPIKTKHTSEWVSTIHPSIEMPGMRTNHQVIGIWETRIALDPKNNPEPSGCCQQRW